MRTQAEIEREMEEIREYVRNFPTMKQYIEPRRAALRDELRATMGIKESTLNSTWLCWFLMLLLILGSVAWIN